MVTGTITAMVTGTGTTDANEVFKRDSGEEVPSGSNLGYVACPDSLRQLHVNPASEGHRSSTLLLCSLSFEKSAGSFAADGVSKFYTLSDRSAASRNRVSAITLFLAPHC